MKEVERGRLTQYLLGRVSDSEREAIASQLFSDPDLTDALEDVERDLLDAYAAATLSPGDRKAVETRLLQSEAQRHKLRFAGAFAARAQGRVRAFHTRWFGVAAAVGIALAGLAAAAYEWRANLQLHREIASVQAQPEPAFLSVLLAPAERGAAPEQRVGLAPGTKLLRLDFEMAEPPGPDRYQVLLSTAAGMPVAELHSLPANGSVISAWIPAGSIGPGRYEAALSRESQKPFAFYYFSLTSQFRP